jgi:hypothetical protein
MQKLKDILNESKEVYIFLDGSIEKLTDFEAFFIGFETPCEYKRLEDADNKEFYLIEAAAYEGEVLDLDYFWDCKSGTFNEEDEKKLYTLDNTTIFKTNLKPYYYTFTNGGAGDEIELTDSLTNEQIKELEKRIKKDPSIIWHTYIENGKEMKQIDFEAVSDLVRL